MALGHFEGGLAETLALIPGSPPVYRYMAPLRVKPACLSCHSVQGYREGDIRGGISVSFDASRLMEMRAVHRRAMITIYGFAFVLISLLVFMLNRRTRTWLFRLREETRTQGATLAMRTAELAEKADERQRDLLRLSESEARYRAVSENGTDGIVIVEGVRISYCNQRAAMMIGYDDFDLIGHELFEFVTPEDVQALRQRQARRQRGEAMPASLRVGLLHRLAGQQVIADVHLSVLDRLADERLRLLLSIRDMTGELSAQREQQIADAVFDSAAEAIMVTDAAGIILRVNPAFTSISGFTPRDAIGRTPSLLGSGRHDAEFFAQMWQQLNARGRWEGEIWNRRKNGEVFVVWLAVTRIAGGEQKGGFVSTFTDITRRKQNEDQMRHSAQHDVLTDLPNRLLFADRMQNALALARRHSRLFGVLYIDLDHFKEVNDTLGHAAGDALLIEVAKRLLALVRASDTVARLGGDEFAVVLAEVNSAREVDDVARRIVASIAEAFALKEGVAHVTASVGVALYPAHGGDIASLKKNADQAMYEAKTGGRNGYRIYSPTPPA